MNISVFDLFSISIGPSSSHTAGAMRAARRFASELQNKLLLNKVTSMHVEIYGSLALTGKGHNTDKAILNGLEGALPETVDPTKVIPRFEEIIKNKSLVLMGKHPIPFDYTKDFIFNTQEKLSQHTNGMQFSAFSNKRLLKQAVFYSIGGGFILEEEIAQSQSAKIPALPFPFDTAKQLFDHCNQHHLTIKEVMLANELIFTTKEDIKQNLLNIDRIMLECINKGLQTEGILPGGLNLKRRAPGLYKKLQQYNDTLEQQSDALNWLNVYAIAVNEENAAGNRVVTAPTNGSAGVIPSVLNYYKNFIPGATKEGIITFLLTAGAIGILYKSGASISGAEVGCQGEIGVASSMAAGALAAALGGTLKQIESAAEIAMEHHLGMTCDPVGGLVQIPCIERNAMGAVKALNAASLAMLESGANKKISLDTIIKTMLQTGKDMKSIYKETSLGGLAVNIIAC